MPKASNKKTSKPTLSIIGSGRLGTALGIALSSMGYRTDAVVTRHLPQAKKSAALIGSSTSALSAEELDLLPPSKIILIATPDDEIAHVTHKLAAAQPNRVSRRIILHTSGALSSEVLAPLAGIGFHVGSLHPLVSVSDPRIGLANLNGAFYCIEGDVGALRVARTIVNDLKGRSFSIRARYKPLYHAAAVMASGHVVTLFDLATDTLVQCGLNPGQAKKVLRPLLESTVSNLLRADATTALTGPFARGDVTTVQRHVSGLSASGLLIPLDVYKALGVHAVEMMKKHGADPQSLDKISKTLKFSRR